MYIMSQSGSSFVNCEKVKMIQCESKPEGSYISVDGVLVGEYESNKRCQEIIQDFARFVCGNEILDKDMYALGKISSSPMAISRCIDEYCTCNIFYMPKD